MAKITDLIKDDGQLTFSYEVTPDLPEIALENLTVSVEPVFFSITWHAKSHRNENLDIPPLRLAKLLKSKNKNVLLHLSCDLLRREYLEKLLAMLQELGIANLFIILGECYDPEKSDFKSSVDLLRCIRKETGNYFCIGVAGFPDCSDEKLLSLKKKVDSGADFIITQACFESSIYKNFLVRCKEIGITQLVLPGIFIFENFNQLNSFINMCKIKVSQNILACVKNINASEDIPGDKICRELIKSVATDNIVHHFHFFTLNKLDKVSLFLKGLRK